LNPAAFFDSVTGMVVVAIIFAVPILAVVGALAVTLSLVNRHHKERMKMIEQGMFPPPPAKPKGTYNGLLITGAILLAFGLALLAGELAGKAKDFTGGFIFGFIGLAMLACFAIIRGSKKARPDENNDAGTAVPPKTPEPPLD